MRSLTRLFMTIGRLLARLASYCRARALFPNNPDVICHWTTEVKCPENITLGRRVVIGSHCTIGAGAPVFLGDDVLLSKGVFVDTGTADISTPVPYRRFSKPISIGAGVWLGAYSRVMAGVTIGENSIIASGVTVRKNVPKDSFVMDEKPRVQSFTQA
ncbi:MAG TPA: acyltransferase [Allosphingosinicella sp.]|nr:acyltransferase [Allosphingosinicella sp.]